MTGLRKGDWLLLPKGLRLWWQKSEEEMTREEEENRAAGYLFDSAGEPVLISSVGSTYLEEDTAALVTKTRGCQWTHWGKKPLFLTEVLINIRGIPRYMMFSGKSRASGTTGA